MAPEEPIYDELEQSLQACLTEAGLAVEDFARRRRLLQAAHSINDAMERLHETLMEEHATAEQAAFEAGLSQGSLESGLGETIAGLTSAFNGLAGVWRTFASRLLRTARGSEVRK